MTTPSLFLILLWGISSASKAVVRKSIIFEAKHWQSSETAEARMGDSVIIFFLCR
jgi:hypothetical protein